MNIETDYLESFAQVQLLYHKVYPLFAFSNSCFNFHANTGHGYSKARRVLSERLELSYFTLGLRIPSRIPSRYLVRT